MSASPSSKRSLKPPPIAAIPQSPQFPPSTDPPSMQSASASGQEPFASAAQLPSPVNTRKRKSVTLTQPPTDQLASSSPPIAAAQPASTTVETTPKSEGQVSAQEPKPKKSRTNTPWTPAEEQRLKQMRDLGNSWSEIAKTFPQRTEGSVKKHWYKDMHYAEFGEDESAALLSAIKEYDANKWKAIGQKVGKPAKACEQYAKEHFPGKF